MTSTGGLQAGAVFIYHTADGGLSWHKQDSGTTVDLWKIFLLTVHTGGRPEDVLMI